MNKAYLIAPVLLLIVFTGFFAVHRTGMKEREAAKIAKIEADRQAKLDAEKAANKAAQEAALAQAEQRKKEKAEKEAKDKADKEARQLAIDARDKAFREQEKSSRQIERLKKDIEVEQAALAKLAAVRKEAEAERDFLLGFVTKTQANVQALQGLMAKLNTPPPAPVAPAAK